MSKIVYQFNKDGQMLASYKSIAEAARNVGVSKETLSAVCNGKRNTAAGYLWGFNSNDIKPIKKDERIWRDIKGFEGKYQMSEDKVVRRLPFEVEQMDNKGNTYKRHFTGKILEQYIDYEGYRSVTLGDEKKRIHWLYYNTFIGDSTGYVIDHIDRNKQNNDTSNLRLTDYSGNVKNRTLPYKPDIYFHKNLKKKPYQLRFTKDKKRTSVGYYATYEEAENKYKELYDKRQKEIDDCFKICSVSS